MWWRRFQRSFSTAALLLFLFHICDLPVAKGLQCYNCRGITNYDPNNCFHPIVKKTVIQECAKNEVCEKRVTMIDRLQDVMDRGCSSNCKDRKFIWTDEFQVYCCNSTFCNSASRKEIGVYATTLITLFVVATRVLL